MEIITVNTNQFVNLNIGHFKYERFWKCVNVYNSYNINLCKIIDYLL